MRTLSRTPSCRLPKFLPLLSVLQIDKGPDASALPKHQKVLLLEKKITCTIVKEEQNGWTIYFGRRWAEKSPTKAFRGRHEEGCRVSQSRASDKFPVAGSQLHDDDGTSDGRSESLSLLGGPSEPGGRPFPEARDADR
jgi:hypothetical protein